MSRHSSSRHAVPAFGRALAVLLAGFALLGTTVMAHAQTADKSPSKVDQATDLVVQAFPINIVFDRAAAQNPNWPLLTKANMVSERQLSCVRGELSSAGYRKNMRTRVAQYAASNESRFSEDVDLLKSGAAQVAGRLFTAGFDSKDSGAKVDTQEVLKSASADQLLSFTSLIMEPKYRELREIIGFGDLFSARKSPEENRKDGESLGMAVAMKLTLKALASCDVSPSLIF